MALMTWILHGALLLDRLLGVGVLQLQLLMVLVARLKLQLE